MHYTPAEFRTCNSFNNSTNPSKKKLQQQY